MCAVDGYPTITDFSNLVISQWNSPARALFPKGQPLTGCLHSFMIPKPTFVLQINFLFYLNLF